jgi:hypothetical protein
MRTKDEIMEGIRQRHALVEASADKMATAASMSYLSHLDRGDLLQEVERMSGRGSQPTVFTSKQKLAEIRARYNAVESMDPAMVIDYQEFARQAHRDRLDLLNYIDSLHVETGCSDGYKDAFYQIAELLDMTAMPISPKEAFETVMLPRLRELVAVKAAAPLWSCGTCALGNGESLTHCQNCGRPRPTSCREHISKPHPACPTCAAVKTTTEPCTFPDCEHRDVTECGK